MKVTTIPQFARNLNRMREVAAILSKYGLADWVSRLNIHVGRGMLRSAEGSRLADLTREARIRLALTELGTTFIKFGQVLSTRADIVGIELAAELSKLQAHVPADPPDTVRRIIKEELGRPVEEIFETFDEVPLASASIAQVHQATLAGGKKVVIKVQHPGIGHRIRNDLDILAGMAELAERYVEELRPYQPKAITAEFSLTLLRELDFGRELRNLERFVTNFDGDPTVCFPAPHPAYSTSRVLVMDFIDGIPVAEAGRLGTHMDREDLAKRGAGVFMAMIFRDGFYHADPHPGNLIVMDQGVIGIIDVGMVYQLTPSMREEMEDLLMGIASNDPELLTATLIHLCGQRGVNDPAAFTADVADFFGYYRGQPVDRLDISRVLTEMTEIIRRHHLILPASIAMLLRVLILLEGTSRLLHPQFRLTEVIVPYQRQMVKARLSPRRQRRRLRNFLMDWQDFIVRLPDQFRGMVQQLRTGRVEVQLQHHHLEPSVNRLVLGLITAALFVGSSYLWGMRAPPTIEDVSIVGVLGFMASVLCAARLVLAVLRSGNLDG
jgi:ubiquinone biosynthesis protein